MSECELARMDSGAVQLWMAKASKQASRSRIALSHLCGFFFGCREISTVAIVKIQFF